MNDILTLMAIGLVCAGTFFSITAVLGFFRLPDIFSRLHATGKVGVFGVVMFLAAVALTERTGWGYALVLMFFLLISSPATAHAIASAAYRLGIRPVSPVRDDLAAARRLKKNQAED